jgi:hypothetical protein
LIASIAPTPAHRRGAGLGWRLRMTLPRRMAATRVSSQIGQWRHFYGASAQLKDLYR